MLSFIIFIFIFLFVFFFFFFCIFNFFCQNHFCLCFFFFVCFLSSNFSVLFLSLHFFICLFFVLFCFVSYLSVAANIIIWWCLDNTCGIFSFATETCCVLSLEPSETVLMRGHKRCFYGEIWKIIPKLFLLPLLIWSTVHVLFFIYIFKSCYLKLLISPDKFSGPRKFILRFQQFGIKFGYRYRELIVFH